MSSLIRRGLDDPRERLCLAACVALCVSYVAVFGLFAVAGTRIDDTFFAQRRTFLLHRLLRNTLPLAVPLMLTEHGRVAPSFVLIGGWSAAEAWGAWTDGPHADFAVALPAAGGARPVLQLWGSVMQPPTGSRTIRLQANGLAMGTWRLVRKQAVICARLPAAAASAAGIVQIGIDVGSPQTPDDGLDAGKRGFGLERVELLADPSQCERQADLPSQ